MRLRRSGQRASRRGWRLAAVSASTVIAMSGVLSLATGVIGSEPASATAPITFTACTTANLNAAVSAGGSYIFNCTGVINDNDLDVTKDVSITATQALEIDGQDQGQIFVVESGTLSLTAVTLYAGFADSGDTSTNGTPGVDGNGGSVGTYGGGPPTGGDGGAGGNGTAGTSGTNGETATGIGAGGAIYIAGGAGAVLNNVGVADSIAVGQAGGSGGNGGSGGSGGAGGAGGCTQYPAGCHIYSGGQGGDGAAGGNGGSGGNGASAQGGGIYAAAGSTLEVTDSDFDGNSAYGGAGGVGGRGGAGGYGGEGGFGSGPWPNSGSGADGGTAGAGGSGGSGAGGAIFSRGTLTLDDDTFTSNRASAGGGNGGYGATINGGSGGGGGAYSIDLYDGPGGPGGAGGSGQNGGSGGDGGDAAGGAIYAGGTLTWDGGSLANNTVTGGTGGNGGGGGNGGAAGGDGAQVASGAAGDGGNGNNGGNGGIAAGGALYPVGASATGVSCTGDTATAGPGGAAGAAGAAGSNADSSGDAGSPGAAGSAGTAGSVSGGEPAFCGPPVISSVAPVAGPLTGGNEVIIRGFGFENPGLSLTDVGFSAADSSGSSPGVAGDDAEVVSNTEITVTAPDATSLAAGKLTLAALVTVYFAEGEESVTTTPVTSGDNTYQFGAPVVASLSPLAGPLVGDNLVTITGSGFENPDLSLEGVIFDPVGDTDGSEALVGETPVVVSDTKITVTAPDATAAAGGASTLDAEVTPVFTPSAADEDADDSSEIITSIAATPGDNWYIFGAPEIDSVTPAAGPLTGGDQATITGSGFENPDLTLSHVSFDTADDPGGARAFDALDPVVVSDTEITITVPDATSAAGSHPSLDTSITAVFADDSDGDSEGNVESVPGTVGADDYLFGVPVINAVSPPGGPVGGGTEITLTGTGFDDPDFTLGEVDFTPLEGADEATPLVGVDPVVISDTEITVTTPDATAEAVDGELLSTSVEATFTDDANEQEIQSVAGSETSNDFFYGAPVIDSVAPVAGPLVGGDEVTITGSGFDDPSLTDLNVTFDPVGSGESSSPLDGDDAVVVSDTEITVTAPDATDEAGGAASLDTLADVTFNATDIGDDGLPALPAHSGDNEYIFGAPEVDSVAPVAGPLIGGDSITITGTGFDNPDLVLEGVSFDAGDDETTLVGESPEVVSDTEVTVTAPDATSAAAGAASVDTTVVLQYESIADESEKINSVPLTDGVDDYIFGAPVIDSIAPATGVLAGGNTVTITGSGFENSDLDLNSVMFTPTGSDEGISGNDPVVVSDTEVTVTAPDATPDADGSASLDTTISVVYNDKADDTVEVSSNPAETGVDDYVFGAPQVDSVSPVAGVLDGGNTVTITGSGFDNPDLTLHDVTFDAGVGGTEMLTGVDPVVVSDTEITVTAPNAMTDADGASDLDATIVLDYDDPAQPDTFVTSVPASAGDDGYVFGAPIINSVAPITGPLDGGNEVTITGSGFDDPDLSLTGVTFDADGTDPLDGVSPVVVSDTEITVTAPDATEAAGGTPSVTSNITANFADADSADQTVMSTAAPGDDTYTFGAPSITSITESVGPILGGNQVVITGTGFSDPSLVLTDVGFDPTNDTDGSTEMNGIDPVVVSDTEITVTAPDALVASDGNSTLETAVTATFGDVNDPGHSVNSIPDASGDNDYEFMTDFVDTGVTSTPGGTVDVDAGGFDPDEPVSITLHSTEVLLATVNASSTGAVNTTVTIPPSTPPGAHELILTGLDSGHSVTIPLTVLAAPTTPTTTPTGTGTGGGSGSTTSNSGTTAQTAGLAFTGTDLAEMVGAGTVFLLMGLLLLSVQVSRRRQSATRFR